MLSVVTKSPSFTDLFYHWSLKMYIFLASVPKGSFSHEPISLRKWKPPLIVEENSLLINLIIISLWWTNVGRLRTTYILNNSNF